MSQRCVKYHLKDHILLLTLLGLITLSSIMLLSLCLSDTPYIQLSSLDLTSDYFHCTSKHELKLYVPLILITRLALLLLTTICAYKIRHTPDLFNETRQLVFTIYNLSFLSIILPTIDLSLGRGRNLGTSVYGVCTLIICTLTTLIMFVPKIRLVMTRNKRRDSCSPTFAYSQKNSLNFIKSNYCVQLSTNIDPIKECSSKISLREPFSIRIRHNLQRSFSSPCT